MKRPYHTVAKINMTNWTSHTKWVNYEDDMTHFIVSSKNKNNLPETAEVTFPEYRSISCLVSSRPRESPVPVSTKVIPSKQLSAPTGRGLEPGFFGPASSLALYLK